MTADATDDLLQLVQPWQIREQEPLVENRVFSLMRRRCVSRLDPTRQGDFYFLSCSDWVNVIALTDTQDVVLVEQYRHGMDLVTLEIPGGMANSGEAPLDAGLRELREETGYGGGEARLIGRVTPNPAIQDNWCYTVLVTGARRLGEPSPDAREELGQRLVPLAEIRHLIAAGTIHHALVVAAFFHLSQLELSPRPLPL